MFHKKIILAFLVIGGVFSPQLFGKSIRAAVVRNPSGGIKQADRLFSVPQRRLAVIRSFTKRDPYTEKTTTKLGNNIFSLASRKIMVDADGKPLLELPPGRYRFTVSGNVGTTAILKYDLVHIRYEILKRNTFLRPQGWGAEKKLLFKLGYRITYNKAGQVIKGILARSCSLRSRGMSKSEKEFPAFLSGAEVVFGKKGGVIKGTLARDWIFRQGRNETEFSRGTAIAFDAQGIPSKAKFNQPIK